MSGIRRESGAWEQALVLAEEIRELAEGMSATAGGTADGGIHRSAAAVCDALAAASGCELPIEAIRSLGIARRALAELAARAGIARALGRVADTSAIASRADRLLDRIDALIRSARKARRT